MYERACQFFDRASQVEPKQIKWRLMVASCYRRMENLDKALKIYEDIYAENPENLECKSKIILRPQIFGSNLPRIG